MFRLQLSVKRSDNGNSVCHIPVIWHYSAIGSCYYKKTTEPVDIEITKPENHLLKTIDFYSHVLIKCPCKSHESESGMMFKEDVLHRKFKKIEKKLRNTILNKKNRPECIIQRSFRVYRSKKLANVLRSHPDNLFCPFFGEMRKKILKIDDSNFNIVT